MSCYFLYFKERKCRLIAISYWINVNQLGSGEPAVRPTGWTLESCPPHATASAP